MRYTRYDYKKKKKTSAGRFILSIILIVFFTVAIATGVGWIAMEIIPTNNLADSEGNNNRQVEEPGGGSEDNSEANSEINIEEEEAVEASGEINNINMNFTVIQCGVFSSEENAKQLLGNISNKSDGFIVKDEELYRVFAGVYNTEDAETVVNTLKASEIDSVKVNYDLDSGIEVETQVAAIVNGYLDILKNASEEEVKSVNTIKFKEWVEELETVSEGDSVDSLANIKEYIKSLPEELEKEDITKEMAYVYTILEQF